MTPDKAGTSANQRPSSSRSISIVNVTRAMYHSGRLSNKLEPLRQQSRAIMFWKQSLRLEATER